MDGCLHRIQYFAFFCCAILSSIAYGDKVNNEWYSPLRTLTMGNAGIALNDDPDTSMFFNPAGLARIRKTSVEILNPLIEVGTGDFNLVHGHLTNLSKNASLSQIQPQLSEHSGQASSLGYSIYPNFQAQNFAFGIVNSGSGASYMDANSTLHYQSRYLIVPTLGMSAGLLSGLLKIGVAVRGVQLTQNDKSTTTFTNIGYLTSPGQGFGLGFDAGAQLIFPSAGLPTFGIVARNIGGVSFGSSVVSLSSSSVGGPSLVRASYDGGFAWQSRDRSNRFTFDADYRDILNSTSTPTLRHVNTGAEMELSKIFYLRAGFGRGYWTAGFGLHGKNGSIELGSYAEELSDSGYHVQEDRRVAIQFGNRF